MQRDIVFSILTIIILGLPVVGKAQSDITKNEKDKILGMAINQDEVSLTTESDSLQEQDIHPQDSPENKGFLIVTTDGRSSLRIRGSIRINGIYDLNGLQSRSSFSTAEIPVGDDNVYEPRFSLFANQTRFGIEATKYMSKIGNVDMRIEGDFLENRNSFRLRHAYGKNDNFLVGQTWSTFSDVASLPQTVDLDGPNSACAARTIQLRYTKPFLESYIFSLAFESPFTEIVTPDSINLKPAHQVTPDIVGRLRKVEPWGHIQAATILRRINVRDTANEIKSLFGYGALLSGRVKLTEKNDLRFQAVYGHAITRFIEALSNSGVDLVFNPGTSEFDPVISYGGYVSVSQEWLPNVVSFFTAGTVNVTERSYYSDEAFKTSYYFSGNIFWNLMLGAKFGFEYSHGQRKNKDNQTGNANRFSFLFYYDF